MLPPEELALAQRLKLNTQSLAIYPDRNGAVCLSPCREGDLKPLDCSWYPLFPVNETATKFLVADHRKCPIPNQALFSMLFEVSASALAWEKHYPGSLVKMAALAKGFVGYLPFPYKIEGSRILEMTNKEIEELPFPKQLPPDYRCEDWPIHLPGYTAVQTPDE